RPSIARPETKHEKRADSGRAGTGGREGRPQGFLRDAGRRRGRAGRPLQGQGTVARDRGPARDGGREGVADCAGAGGGRPRGGVSVTGGPRVGRQEETRATAAVVRT